MRDEDEGFLSLREVPNHFRGAAHIPVVKSAGRLVKKDDLRLRKGGERDAEPLFLSSGEREGMSLHKMLETKRGKQREDFLPGGSFPRNPQRQLVFDAVAEKLIIRVLHDEEGPSFAGEGIRSFPAEKDLSPALPEKAADRAGEGGFSDPVGACDAEDLSRFRHKAEIFQERFLFSQEGKSADLQSRYPGRTARRQDAELRIPQRAKSFLPQGLPRHFLQLFPKEALSESALAQDDQAVGDALQIVESGA